jgi:hypothetical protein
LDLQHTFPESAIGKPYRKARLQRDYGKRQADIVCMGTEALEEKNAIEKTIYSCNLWYNRGSGKGTRPDGWKTF